jgi:hypothetical protein
MEELSLFCEVETGSEFRNWDLKHTKQEYCVLDRDILWKLEAKMILSRSEFMNVMDWQESILY